jgi:hypothetical protein
MKARVMRRGKHRSVTITVRFLSLSLSLSLSLTLEIIDSASTSGVNDPTGEIAITGGVIRETN